GRRGGGDRQVDGELFDIKSGADEAAPFGGAQQLERKQREAPGAFFETGSRGDAIYLTTTPLHRECGRAAIWALPHSRCCEPRKSRQRRRRSPRQAALSTRARRSTNPARPYICRLIVFNRFTCPSTGPLLHLCVTAACTDASSPRMPSANRRRAGSGEASPRVSHSLNVPVDCLRIRFANPSARSSAAASSALQPRMASSRACSGGFRFSGRRTQSRESCLADGGLGAGGVAALSRSRFLPAAPSRFVTNA